MNKYALVFLLFFTPISYSATETEKNLSNPLVPETPFKKLGNELKLNCKDVGSESCFSRFIGLSACTFMYGIAKNDKTVKESLDIADDLFLLLAKGNNLDPNDMFDEKDLIKQAIRVETVERVEKCKEWARQAIPKIVLERTGKEATPEFIDGATKTFGMWWLHTLEQVKRGNYKK